MWAFLVVVVVWFSGSTLHYIKSYLEWPKVQILLNHYYTRCGELETENS